MLFFSFVDMQAFYDVLLYFLSRLSPSLLVSTRQMNKGYRPSAVHVTMTFVKSTLIEQCI